MIKDLRAISVEDEELQKLQDNVSVWAQQITPKQVIDGVLLKDVSLVSGQPNVIAHKLGRELVGWFASRLRAEATVWESDDNVFPSKNVVLMTSADVTTDLWVF